MPRKVLLPIVAVVVAAVALVFWFRRDDGRTRYTGFVEGEERILRSEVAGRILEVTVGEGDAVEAGAVIARLDDSDVAARLEAKQRERGVVAADIRAQEERVQMTEEMRARDLAARRAELRQAEAESALAERTFARERELVATGASTAQLLDEARARRDQARSAVDRGREMLARAESEERDVAVATAALEALRERAKLVDAQVAELEVLRAKYVIRAPAVATRTETQFAWPGELAQPGTAIVSVLDPKDKYVQIYVPVADAAGLEVGRRVEIDIDGRSGRTPGEIVFIADKASFTPEKIETQSDRLGQVYRAKVRILEGVESIRAGTEGEVYLVEGGDGAPGARVLAEREARG